MRSDIAPGGTFPDYELPDHENVPRKLSEIQGDDPLILTLARGNYCPKEHQQHLELAANYPKIAVAYTKIATISTDTHHSSQEFRASTGAQWPFLSDPERTVQKDLEIQEYTDPEHDPMIPHTLVLKPGLVIHSIYNGYWFWGRPSFVDLWHDLRDRHPRDPPRLGSEQARAARSVGCGRLLAISRMEQALPSVDAVVLQFLTSRRGRHRRGPQSLRLRALATIVTPHPARSSGQLNRTAGHVIRRPQRGAIRRPEIGGGCRKIATPGRLFVTARQRHGEAEGAFPHTAGLGPRHDDRAR